MKTLRTFRAAMLMSAVPAVLALGACNPNSGAPNGDVPNGAYVSTSADSSSSPAPTTSDGQTAPPRNTYRWAANTAPPPLPDYDQPPIPQAGDVWTPGYWAWSSDDDDYYWVPGAWVEPPTRGDLWTPGYWRYDSGRYYYSDGYWGPQVGYYGGVNYGYGYGGQGYDGGRWQGDRFYYNDRANNLTGLAIAAVYSAAIADRHDHASFNGGPGGLRTAPTSEDMAAAQQRHAPPTRNQMLVVDTAKAEPQQRAGANRGAPPIAAVSRPTAFHSASGVTAARSAANYTPPPRPGPAARLGAAPQAAPSQGPGSRSVFGIPNGARAPATATVDGPMARDQHPPTAAGPAADRRLPDQRPTIAPPPPAEHRAPEVARQAPPALFKPQAEAPRNIAPAHVAPRLNSPGLGAPAPRPAPPPHVTAPQAPLARPAAPVIHAAPAVHTPPAAPAPHPDLAHPEPDHH